MQRLLGHEQAVVTRPARVVVIDFPWFYRNRHEHRLYDDGVRNKKRSSFGLGVAARYNHGVMQESELIEVARLLHLVTADDAYVFSWATKAALPTSLKIMEAAGWQYATTAFVWVKTNPLSQNTFKGAGRYTFSNTEDLQLWRKPKSICWHTNTGWKPEQVVMAPHPRKNGKIIHSRKPDEFMRLIDRWLVPQMRYDDIRMELFATKKTDGWLCFGGDVTGLDIRDDLWNYWQKIHQSELLTVS